MFNLIWALPLAWITASIIAAMLSDATNLYRDSVLANAVCATLYLLTPWYFLLWVLFIVSTNTGAK